jgi:RNA polymerase sigma factor (sigma-70 family)
LDVVNGDLMNILEGCRQNDRLSQSKLFALLEPYALRICYWYHSNTDEVSDIISESFFKLFNKIGCFDITRCTEADSGLKAWFKRIIVNTCIDHLRKNMPGKNIIRELTGTEILADAAENGCDRLAYKEIIESIQQLPPSYRAVFNLYVIEGMKHEEIARLLAISVGASKSNLFKARNHLRDILKNGNTTGLSSKKLSFVSRLK